MFSNEQLRVAFKQLNETAVQTIRAPELADYLFSCDVLADQDYLRLVEITSPTGAARHLLALLHTKPHPLAFIKLREALTRAAECRTLVGQVEQLCLEIVSPQRTTQLSPDLEDRLTRLQKLKPQLIERFYAKKVAALMHTQRLVSASELESIQCSDTMTEAAKRLLDIILRRFAAEIFGCFLIALIETNQQHICSWISSDDSEMDQSHVAKIQRHYTYLVENIDSSTLINALYTRQVIDLTDMEDLQAKQTATSCNEKLLSILRRKSAKEFQEFLSALTDINQAFVVDEINRASKQFTISRIQGSATLAHTGRGTGGSFTGMALLRDEIFVTLVGYQNVRVYDASSLKFKRNIPIPGLGQWPCGLAGCPVNNCLYLSCENDNCVRRIDLSTDGILTWKSGERPFGLSLNSKNNVIVTGYEGLIQEYTSNGTLLREVVREKNLWHTIETEHGTLLVSGYYHGVEEITWDGQVLHTYGNRFGSGESELKHSRSLSVDSNGFIILADKTNSRFHVLNPSFTAAHILSLPCNVNMPIAHCYDESRGRLYAVEYGGPTRLLAFDHVTNLSAFFEE